MSINLFKNFDFSLLDLPDFKEDSVREELITPLLHALGYKAYGEFQILRSKPLVHPFVMIGSKKHKINIPHKAMVYLLIKGNENEVLNDQLLLRLFGG
jgi:hypothetical protein